MVGQVTGDDSRHVRGSGSCIFRWSIRDTWFESEDLGQGILRLREPYVDPLIRAGVYLIRGRERDLVIDSGTGIAALRPFLPVTCAEPVAVATHAHYDHVGGLADPGFDPAS